jgi:hypothetical protein
MGSLIRGTIGLALLVAITRLGAPIEAMAQEARAEVVGPAATARTFGTGSSIVHTIQAHAFAPQGPADADRLLTNGSALVRVCIGGPCQLAAPVSVPAGAVLESLELDACDNSAAGQVSAELIRVAARSSASQQLGIVQTGIGAMPDCDLFSAPLTALTVDNRNNTYTVTVSITGGGANTALQAVRVFYHLQVSPAPAIATFDDVPPGHPFFPFIEALVAAGITIGCSESPPLFCPDGVVTRKQMAAFIARALGLHFAP